MKKLTAFVMIVCMGMFCSLGCSKPAQDKPIPPVGGGEEKPADNAKDKAPAAPEEGKEMKEAKEAPAETPAETPAEPAPEKKAGE